MVEVTILIPLAGNDGESFSVGHHAEFEAFAVDRMGGLSRFPGAVAGKWAHEGTIYTDRLVAYVVAVPSILDTTKLAEVVAFAKRHYSQLAIYIRYLGIAETV